MLGGGRRRRGRGIKDVGSASFGRGKERFGWRQRRFRWRRHGQGAEKPRRLIPCNLGEIITCIDSI